MNRLAVRLLETAAALLLIAGTASAQKVKTTYSGNFDFATHKRYAWGKNHIITRQGPQNDVLIDQKIVKDVNRNLADKGFVEDPANPDFLRCRCRRLLKRCRGRLWEVDASSTRKRTNLSRYGIPQNIWYSVDGHITFHLVAADTKQPIWTAAATKTIRDPHRGMKDMERQVEQFISKTFKSFPPSTKK